MEAAKADPRYEPLVKMMDQTGHVDRAFRQLQSMRAAEAAAAKEGARPPQAPIQLSVAAYNEAFPKYPPLSK
ncbi:MAG: hypothetical protein WAN75_00390, partial [Xanthobacteraceae bacterium]